MRDFREKGAGMRDRDPLFQLGTYNLCISELEENKSGAPNEDIVQNHLT